MEERGQRLVSLSLLRAEFKVTLTSRWENRKLIVQTILYFALNPWLCTIG